MLVIKNAAQLVASPRPADRLERGAALRDLPDHRPTAPSSAATAASTGSARPPTCRRSPPDAESSTRPARSSCPASSTATRT